MYETLKSYEKHIEDVRANMLFAEGFEKGDLMTLESQQYFLLALSYLESARRFMAIAAILEKKSDLHE